MIENINKITPMHVLYVIGAGAAAGFLFVLLDRFLIGPLEPALGIGVAPPVI